jgi:hypothetical protein
MKVILTSIIFVIAGVLDLIFSIGRVPVLILVLSVVVVLYSYVSPYILKR